MAHPRHRLFTGVDRYTAAFRGGRMARSPHALGGQEWTPARLRTWLSALNAEEAIVVLANREPFRHDHTADGRIVFQHSTGGLVTALEPLIEACSGVWVAHGVGTADQVVVDERDRILVPPASPRYRLRRVWLDACEEGGYYYGFANEGLWPLCHRAHVRPTFRPSDFSMYEAVNRRFARAVCEEVETDCPLVLVQDYHFALAPQLIRQRLPFATIITFWHIPWPAPKEFARCPWSRELLQGLLGSSIIGLQTSEDCRNFIDNAARLLDANVSRSRARIVHSGRHTLVRAYPVSIEWPNRWVGQSPPIETCRADVRRRLGLSADVLLGLGIDRLDYTKGIPEKFLAVERLLESHPELCGQFVFVQIAEPSRECLSAYRDLRSRIVAIADGINARFGDQSYRPIVLLEGHHEPPEVYRFLRAADVCYVGSLHDGMNLVAKEFVAAREDERGALILSQFTGAARELTSAVIIDPYAIGDAARALFRALFMSDEEQASRMRAMRSVVAASNTYKWAGAILADAMRVRALPSGSNSEIRVRWPDDAVHT
ncbi:MAG: trehalose-6-phosphate synthase [Blastocatellia bacterium]|nr:MAG: trehalose-6-phosphate synthase [Blastocatellia bacterium]